MNILIIDDYESSRLGTALFMQELVPDIAIFHAESCENGIAIAQHQPLHLVMLDIKFPRGRLQGLEALVEIKRQFESLCVVVYSGVDDDRELVFDALRKGAMGFVPKGLGKADFIHALRTILAGSPYLPPFVIGSRSAHGATDIGTGNPTELSLTPRQFDVLRWFVQGLSNKEIAQRLDIAPDTVKNHLKPIFIKFGVGTRTQLIAEIYRQGIVLGKPEVGNS